MTATDPWRAYLEKSRDKPANPITTAAAQLNQSGLMQAVDVGCGAGHDSAELAALGYSVIAYDASPEVVQFCEQRFADCANVQVQQGQIETFDYPSTGLITAFSSLFFCRRNGSNKHGITSAHRCKPVAFSLVILWVRMTIGRRVTDCRPAL